MEMKEYGQKLHYYAKNVQVKFRFMCTLKNTLTLRDQQTAKQPHQPQGSATIMIIIII